MKSIKLFLSAILMLAVVLPERGFAGDRSEARLVRLSYQSSADGERDCYVYLPAGYESPGAAGRHGQSGNDQDMYSVYHGQN